MGRGDHVIVLERSADADGDGLLADRDVQEAGQLAGAEALLDLLLEAADEEHLAEELEPKLARELAFSLDLRHESEFMLAVMRLVEQWRKIEADLPENWADARLLLRLADPTRRDRAAALLAPLNAGRVSGGLRFYCARRGSGPLPETMERLLERLDREGIEGTLELISSGEAEAPRATERVTLAATWDAAVGALPPDWSDLYVEVELASTDYLERAAVLLAPVNPARYGGRPGFRFRCARNFGYGTSPGMVRRCLARLDEEGIRGHVRILRALSDTDPVGTQGPVWYVGGRSV
jgi:hypothetical protein